MKKIITLILLAAISTISFGQELVVAGFTYDPTDQTALLPETEQFDQNGERCALIKVETNAKGFSFDVGMMGVTKVEEQHAGEIWVYVPHDIRRITIQHPQLGVVRNYYFNDKITSGCTYILKLASGEVETTVTKAIAQQFVEFHIKPKNALVEFDGQLIPTDENGIVSKFVNFGTYDYRVEASNYYTEAGKVTVDDPKKKTVVELELMPAFGTVVLQGTSIEGATVYLDNQIQPKSLTLPIVKSGRHTLKLLKPLYLPFVKAFEIKDEERLVIPVELVPNFSTITFTVGNNAEIWINGKLAGRGKVTDKFEEGMLMIECRKQGHRTTTDTYQVRLDESNTTVELKEPKPIYGELTITSTPRGATIVMDGDTLKQTTPCFIPQTLSGKHNITLIQNGYQILQGEVIVTESEQTIFDKQLVKIEQKQRISTQGIYGESNNSLAIAANGATFNMILVKGGQFKMGATAAEQGAASESEVQHEVRLSDFYIGQTEVTQELWQAIMGANPSYHKGDNLPVHNISWNDCQRFIRKLNELTGLKFALPTEAQWEYAARGGELSKGYKFAGSNNIADVAVYSVNSQRQPQTVGSKSPNELGIYDMSGNVYEWCNDWYGPYNTQIVQLDPKGATPSATRVMRGGCYMAGNNSCRVAARSSGKLAFTSNYYGLRLILTR